MMEGPGADSEEKHEPVSDIDTAVVVVGLKALDPEWPIREAIDLQATNRRKGSSTRSFAAVEFREKAYEGACRWWRIWRTGGGRAAHPERGGVRRGHHDLRGGRADGRWVLSRRQRGEWLQPTWLRVRQGISLHLRAAQSIPSASNPSISVTDEFFAFNTGEPYHDRAHIFDRDGRIVHGPRFGLSMGDGLSLARVLLMPEAMLDGRRIEEFFSRRFFSTEFWFLWSTIMGSLPEHSAIEFRRYMNRFLYLFGHLSDMTGVMRTPINQHQAFIEPLVAWLRPRGVNFLTGAFVQDIDFAPSPGRMTVDRLDYTRGGSVTSVAVASEDLVLVTTGSQAADLSAGSMTEAPRPRPSGRSWALETRLAEGRPEFGKPDAFFGEARIPLSRWVTFTVTDTGTEFIDPNVRADRQRAGTRRARDFEGLGLGAIVVPLPPAGNHRPAARHERLVGLRSVSRTQRRFCAQTHGSMLRCGRSWRRRCGTSGSTDTWSRSWRHRFACLATCPTSTIPGSPGAAAISLPRFRRGRPISD